VYRIDDRGKQPGEGLMRSATPDSLQGIRTELVARLRARMSEIEDAVFARVRALSEPSEAEDAELVAGLRAAVAEALDYGLMSIEHGEERLEPIPAAASSQARRGARHGARLDTILRRYAAGDRLLGEFIMDEADRFPSQALKQVLRAHSPQVDRLMAVVATEYMREIERMRRSPQQRVAERVQKLLAGDGSIDIGDLGYELDAWHVGVIVLGAEAEEAARALATGLGCQGLVVPRGEGVVWAWLGSRRPQTPLDAERLWAVGVSRKASLAIGESRRGIVGWRLTHHEAQAAFEVMLRRPRRLTHSSDTVLLAAVLRDEALTKSLRETYLEPLDEHGNSGEVLRETVRAYFAAGFNAATAAAALEVDRHTVQRRLRKVEETLGRLLHACHAELEVALRLEELEAATAGSGSLVNTG
jgi:PucR-like helix-turn-helix protein/diguanylate cyclase with GGDEF domain